MCAGLRPRRKEKLQSEIETDEQHPRRAVQNLADVCALGRKKSTSWKQTDWRKGKGLSFSRQVATLGIRRTFQKTMVVRLTRGERAWSQEDENASRGVL